jgi:hypothetical protein
MDTGWELTAEQAQQHADVDNARVGEVPGHFQAPRLWLVPSAGRFIKTKPGSDAFGSRRWGPTRSSRLIAFHAPGGGGRRYATSVA